MTPRWVLISATEALLVLNKDAALTAHRLWKMETLRWCFRGNHEAGAWRKVETCPYLHFAHKSYMWGFLYILSLGEQGRGGSQELLPALITQSTVYYSQNFLMRQPEPKEPCPQELHLRSGCTWSEISFLWSRPSRVFTVAALEVSPTSPVILQRTNLSLNHNQPSQSPLCPRIGVIAATCLSKRQQLKGVCLIINHSRVAGLADPGGWKDC